MSELFAARVVGTDVTHLAHDLGGEGLLRAICLDLDEIQLFRMERAKEGERLAWCGYCADYRDYLAAREVLATAPPASPRLNGRVVLD